MHIPEFDSFRVELLALADATQGNAKKTLRDEALRERFRYLFRSWASTVEPSIRAHVQNRREVFKLSAELEKLAQLAAKVSPFQKYRERLRTARRLADCIVIYLPARDETPTKGGTAGHERFLTAIPDLPLSLVPNSILGWRSRMEAFLQERPFDKTVFIMVRYRETTKALIEATKQALADNNLFGVVASEHHLTDDLYNPVACLLCCSRGIAIFDRAEKKEKFNPNVAYELGMLHLLGRECLILKHNSLKSLQTDILMKIYTPFNSRADIQRCADEWVKKRTEK